MDLNHGKYLGVDYGDKRTGLAECDVSGLIAGGIGTISEGGMKKTAAVFAVFAGTEETGYQFVIASEKIKLKAKIPEIKNALGGKCGGSDQMLFGHAEAKKEEILAYFSRMMRR